MANWDMFRELDNLKKEVDEAFRGAGLGRPFGAAFLSPLTTRRFPFVNFTEDDANLYVDALVPGVDPGALDLSVVSNSITISGERKPLEEQDGQLVHRCEIGYGKFSRTVELPVDINPDKIRAECRDGIMQITLGKAESAIPRKIEIKSAKRLHHS